MIVTPLPGRSRGAIRDALLSHGWEGVLAAESAAALEAWGYHLTGLIPGQVEALLQVAPRFGLEVLTGDDWAVLTGSRSRLSAMARSWHLPELLRPLMVPVGQGLPADPPAAWLIKGGPVEAAERPLVIGIDVAVDGFIACRAIHEDLAAIATRVESEGMGLLLRATDPASPSAQLTAALDTANRLGVTPERIALDPAWGPGSPDLDLIRALGRPIVCVTDDAVLAVMAWERGARIFETALPEIVGPALARARALGA